jgi:plastocyanin
LYPSLKENKIINQIRKMNIKTNSKTKITTTTSIIAILSIAMITSVILGSINFQNLQQYAKGQMDNGSKAESANEYKNISSAANTSTGSNDTSATVVVNPVKSTNKEFWINTVHFDGLTNINAGLPCDTCMQNGPTHPAEKPPLNSTIPTGGGFRITEPNKVGAWDFRSFTFSPSQIIVNQGDKVTLHFIGVQGAHHIITVDGIGTFSLNRGQIHTVSFIATSPGTINYTCHLHMPNMVGQILVLPKSA